jgi:cytochrome P450
VDARIAMILDGEPGEPSLIRDMAATRVPEADHRMDRRAFRDEAVTLLLAGCGTTASLITWALYLLSQDRMSAVRLRREADAVLGARVAGLDDLPHLPFTAAVVDETARLFPPVPLLSREALGPDRIGKREVRRGSIVLACPWLLHRRPSIWEEPDAFIPDRFLPGAPKPERYAYIPFGVGPRLCAGQHLGLATVAIGLATLAGSFTLRLESGTAVMPVARLTLRPGEALPMRITPRRR